MSQYVRMQMLYRPDQREALKEYAKKHDVSVTEAARRALDLGLQQFDRDDEFARRAEALQMIKEFHDQILARTGGKPLDINPPEDLRQIREERIAQLGSDS